MNLLILQTFALLTLVVNGVFGGRKEKYDLNTESTFGFGYGGYADGSYSGGYSGGNGFRGGYGYGGGWYPNYGYGYRTGGGKDSDRNIIYGEIWVEIIFLRMALSWSLWWRGIWWRLLWIKNVFKIVRI